jgi:uncharacterized membrane protein
MSEFVFQDGRKAEKVENKIDPMTNVTEIYVEPKQEKKLAQRITEKFCVCEREIETINESTGEVVDRFVEKLCEGRVETFEKKSPVFAAVEKKISEKTKLRNYVFLAAILVQLAVLAYVVFGM